MDIGGSCKLLLLINHQAPHTQPMPTCFFPPSSLSLLSSLPLVHGSSLLAVLDPSALIFFHHTSD